MSKSKREQQLERQRKDNFHQGNLQGQSQQGESAQILQTLSEVDDLPIDPKDDEVMGQLVSKLTSTANLTQEQVKSNEWVREYILILYLSKFPTEDGSHGSWRGWQHGDIDQAREPMQPEERMKLETHVSMSKLALSRSEGAKVIEEGARNVSESILNEGEGEGAGGKGLLGKIGLK